MFFGVYLFICGNYLIAKLFKGIEEIGSSVAKRPRII